MKPQISKRNDEQSSRGNRIESIPPCCIAQSGIETTRMMKKSRMTIDATIRIDAIAIFQILLLLLLISCCCSGLPQQQQIKKPVGIPFTTAFTSASGLPVCRYALGGAARSNQPPSIVSRYDEYLKQQTATASTKMAPFLFYYNPHRYPAFINGIRELCSESNRQDLFIASGGSDRSDKDMDQRLDDALAICGGDYLDMFVIEYVQPHEMINDGDTTITRVLKKAASWVEQGRVRYVAASTHSHVVGKQLVAGTEIQLDAIMLRYNMAHRKAAQAISFPAARQAKIPVLAFTTTRWNALQKGHKDWNSWTSSGSGNDDDNDHLLPSTGDCLSFALAASTSPPVEIVLHSARDEAELLEALDGLQDDLSANDFEEWSRYGDLDWNGLDGFDEYPEEEQQQLMCVKE
jgi:aryl-alcohol dehydrogenase-like predicted oxidoreductase